MFPDTVTTVDEIRDAFLAWISDNTSREIVLLNDGESAKPRNPYATVFVNTEELIGQPFNVIDDAENETVYSQTILSIDINLYGNNPMSDAALLIASLWKADRYLDLWQICGLNSIGDRQDLSFLETGHLKQRVLFNVSVIAMLSSSNTADIVESLPIEFVSDVPLLDETIDGAVDPNQKAAICGT